jgi:phospholipase/carboxylesterase
MLDAPGLAPAGPTNRTTSGLTMPASKITRAADHPAEGFRPVTVPGATGRPACVYLPTDYQPKYAYPLVVLFHADGEGEEHVARLVPQLSHRNYIVLCLRGSVDVGAKSDGRPAFAWSATTDSGAKRAIAHVAKQFSVHTQRVFLVGIGEGAGAAYQLGLELGDRVAGLVLLNGRLPKGRVRRNSLRVLVCHGTANPVTPLSEAKRAATTLSRAGASVRVTRYATAARVCPEMLADANRWIMAQVTGKSVASVR